VCGAIFSERGGEFFTCNDSLLQDLLQYSHRRAWVFAHGLQYDLPLLEGPAFPKGELLFTRHNLLWSTYQVAGRKFRLYDSMNLFPRLAIEALGSMVSVPKLVLPGEILHHLSRGRPWAFFTRSEQDQIRRYCMRDAEILYLAIQALQEIALSVGGSLRPTIAGTAMDVFRRTYMKWPWPVVGPSTNQLAWPAYYGGRCENFAYGKVPEVNAYDTTSLYPYVQSKTKYPHPHYLQLETSPERVGSWLEWEGVCEAVVEVPECFVPPLPHRYSRRLFFPTGKITGVWPIVEIRHALDVGCQLHSVNWVLGSKVTFNPFEDFVETLFAKRVLYQQGGDPKAALIKLILNSLYGRWGLSPGGGLYTLVNLDTKENVDLPDNAQTIVSPYGLYAYTPLENLRQPEYVNILFAAQIAAAARLHLLKVLEYQNENLCYCDTDSVITRGSLPTSSALGGWREEMRSGTADLLSPKEYAITRPGMGTQYITKGVPGTVSAEYFQKGIARFTRALGVREAIAQGRNPSEWVQVTKKRGAILPKRWPLYPGSSGSPDWVSSRPFSGQELALVTAGAGLPPDGDLVYPGLILPVLPRPEQPELF
jgi:hypothetical protein